MIKRDCFRDGAYEIDASGKSTVRSLLQAINKTLEYPVDTSSDDFISEFANTYAHYNIVLLIHTVEAILDDEEEFETFMDCMNTLMTKTDKFNVVLVTNYKEKDHM